MAEYAVELESTGSTSTTLGTIGADATRPRRGRWFYLCFGSNGSPADNAFMYKVQRCTALGTSTAVTPQPLDPSNAATEADAGENHSVEPTYTANAFLLTVPLNQRNTFQWHALSPKQELVYPATASNGLGLHTPTASAVTIKATVHFTED